MGEKMKKKALTILILSIIAIVLFGFTNVSFVSATINTGNYDARQRFQSDPTVNNMGKTIVTIVRTIGIIVALAGLMIIGIKYMMGSVEQRAEYKKSMIPYILGCVFIFMITWIVSTIASMTTDVVG